MGDRKRIPNADIFAKLLIFIKINTNSLSINIIEFIGIDERVIINKGSFAIIYAFKLFRLQQIIPQSLNKN